MYDKEKIEILRRIAKEHKTVENIVIELVKLMPKGIFFEILDLAMLDIELPYETNKSLIKLYYKLGKKAFENNAKVQAYFKENFDDYMTII